MAMAVRVLYPSKFMPICLEGEQIRRFADQFDGEPLTEAEALRIER